MSPYVRTVVTPSKATAVQVVWSSKAGRKTMTHIGSAHSPDEVERLKLVARQQIREAAPLQDELDFGDGLPRRGALPILSSRAGHLWDALSAGYAAVGLDRSAGGDEVFKQLVLARIIEPTSKLEAIRVLDEIGISSASYRTFERRLPVFAKPEWRRGLAAGFAAHVGLGPATLLLYDVTTLYFETDQGDGFREPGYSKERRLEPQITVGLLTDVRGFPLMIHEFEGNKAEKHTMLPVLQQFMAAHRLTDVTIVADAGMMSDANVKAIGEAGYSFIIGQPIPQIPWVVKNWLRDHPTQTPPDQLILTHPWARGPVGAQQAEKIVYQYRADRARRALRGVEEQVRKAQAAIDGKVPVKRNRFITLTGARKSLNVELETKSRALAGWKGYVTNLVDATPEFIIGAYHQLWQIEKSFRMSKSDLRARPVYHHKQQSIEAHLTIVFAALAVTRWLETTTGASIKQLVKTLRRYRTIEIQAGGQIVTAEDPLPTDIVEILNKIHGQGVH